MPVSCLFNKWDVHENDGGGEMVAEERRFLGEVIAQKEKKGCPQLSTLKQLYEGELEN